MKERPILFSSAMINAILGNRKSQTRRIIKPQPESVDHINHKMIPYNGSIEFLQKNLKCPYGQTGYVLWVRETWRIVGWWDGEPFKIQFKDGEVIKDIYLDESRAEDYNIQCTDECLAAGLKSDSDCAFHFTYENCPTKWRPSIFMPKIASRLKLKVTNIRVERLQDITEEDAIAEGITMTNTPHKGWYWMENVYSTDTATYAYEKLWESINGKDSWEKNSWVWVIEFEKL